MKEFQAVALARYDSATCWVKNIRMQIQTLLEKCNEQHMRGAHTRHIVTQENYGFAGEVSQVSPNWALPAWNILSSRLLEDASCAVLLARVIGHTIWGYLTSSYSVFWLNLRCLCTRFVVLPIQRTENISTFVCIWLWKAGEEVVPINWLLFSLNPGDSVVHF